MNFEEKLDKFISTNASLKPIVLKLYEDLEKQRNNSNQFYSKWNDRLSHHPIMGFACEVELSLDKTLAEIEQMIGGGK